MSAVTPPPGEACTGVDDPDRCSVADLERTTTAVGLRNYVLKAHGEGTVVGLTAHFQDLTFLPRRATKAWHRRRGLEETAPRGILRSRAAGRPLQPVVIQRLLHWTTRGFFMA